VPTYGYTYAVAKQNGARKPELSFAAKKQKILPGAWQTKEDTFSFGFVMLPPLEIFCFCSSCYLF
jgi:hypothetical protein